jgi:hypothetical protein
MDFDKATRFMMTPFAVAGPPRKTASRECTLAAIHDICCQQSIALQSSFRATAAPPPVSR